MADTKGKKELTEDEYASLAPSDRAHYDVKGRLGDGVSDEDTESQKAAREAAFSEDAGADAQPDPSSVTRTRSPRADEGPKPTRKATGKDNTADGKGTHKEDTARRAAKPKESGDGRK